MYKNNSSKKITVWFGKEVKIEEVRITVQYLRTLGHTVRAPFYIGNELNNDIVRHYLMNSVDSSDVLYLIGHEGSLLEEIIEYTNSKNKPIIHKESCDLFCCQS